jgi:hypothetical protein
VDVNMFKQETYTRKTHKLLQVCKQVATNLFTSCRQLVLVLLVVVTSLDCRIAYTTDGWLCIYYALHVLYVNRHSEAPFTRANFIWQISYVKDILLVCDKFIVTNAFEQKLAFDQMKFVK